MHAKRGTPRIHRVCAPPMTSVCSVPLGIPRRRTVDEPVRRRRGCTCLFHYPSKELSGDIGLVLGRNSWYIERVKRKTGVTVFRYVNREKRFLILGHDMRTCLKAEELLIERIDNVLKKIKRPRRSSTA